MKSVTRKNFALTLLGIVCPVGPFVADGSDMTF